MTSIVSILVRSGVIAAALGAGVAFVLQQAVNASLRASIGSVAWAGFVSYLGGTICMMVLAALMGEGFPAAALWTTAPWWKWTGGIFGAIYIAASILLVPRIGVATFIGFLLAGQMICSLVMDHFGLMGLSPQPIGITRLLGAVMLVGGAILVRS
jgi:transporter family-2 protein